MHAYTRRTLQDGQTDARLFFSFSVALSLPCPACLPPHECLSRSPRKSALVLICTNCDLCSAVGWPLPEPSAPHGTYVCTALSCFAEQSGKKGRKGMDRWTDRLCHAMQVGRSDDRTIDQKRGLLTYKTMINFMLPAKLSMLFLFAPSLNRYTGIGRY